MERYKKFEKAIIEALQEIVSSQAAFDAGMSAFFLEIKDHGSSEEVALSAALNTVTTDPQDFKEGYDKYYSSKDEWTLERKRRNSRIATTVGGIITAILALIFVGMLLRFGIDAYNASREAQSTPTASEASTPVATPETTPVTTTATPTPAPVSTVAAIMTAIGWPDESYKTGSDVDLSKDRSTAGNGSFSKDGVKTIPEMIGYLQSGTKGAIALLGQIAFQTGASPSEILDATNWTVIQSSVAFQYPGNTSLRDGVVVDAGSRKGKVGDIFFMFLSPSTGKYTFIRGACVNPQAVPPTPPNKPTSTPTPAPTPTPVVTPTPSPSPSASPTPTPPPTASPTPPPTATSTPTPKFTSPDKVPGSGTERDTGTGTKPPVPLVTTPAESTPPPVNTTGGTVTAPGATPVVTPRVIPPVEVVITSPTPAPTPVPTPTPTPRPIPTPEPATGTGTNTGDPGNPF